VLGPATRQGFEDEQVERPLQAVVGVLRHSWLYIAGYYLELDGICQPPVAA
jgi:hypothetical protein